MSFATGVALALAVLGTNTASAQVVPQPMPQSQTVQQYVEGYFANEPIMIAIAGCESNFRQNGSNGSVYRGQIDNQDVGVMQINEHYQGARAQKLGFDIYTLEGNTAYAQFLYEKAGTKPWNSSKACWGQDEVSASIQSLALASQ